MKDTAIEWLIKEIEEKYNFRFGNFYWAEIQQAKEMEREQIMDAHYALKYGCFSKDYYNKTFKSE